MKFSKYYDSSSTWVQHSVFAKLHVLLHVLALWHLFLFPFSGVNKTRENHLPGCKNLKKISTNWDILVRKQVHSKNIKSLALSLVRCQRLCLHSSVAEFPLFQKSPGMPGRMPTHMAMTRYPGWAGSLQMRAERWQRWKTDSQTTSQPQLTLRLMGVHFRAKTNKLAEKRGMWAPPVQGWMGFILTDLNHLKVRGLSWNSCLQSLHKEQWIGTSRRWLVPFQPVPSKICYPGAELVSFYCLWEGSRN